MYGSFRSIVWLISSLLCVFATHRRFLSSVKLLVNKALFYSSSLYLKNIVSSVQLLYKQRYHRLIFSGPSMNQSKLKTGRLRAGDVTYGKNKTSIMGIWL